MANQTQDVRRGPVVLCVLDGWGLRQETEANAIALAHTPVMDRLWRDCPHAQLITSGAAVGLPEGQMGNSEVGHLTIGAGRVIFQDLPLIDRAIANGDFVANPTLQAAIARLRQSGGRAQLLGMIGPGGVHAHQDHLLALAQALQEAGIPTFIHAITDGRDTPPQAGRDQLRELLAAIAAWPLVQLGSLCGRYYAMDRDRRYERTERAWRLLVLGEGGDGTAPLAALTAHYAADPRGDEFLPPLLCVPTAPIRDGDGLFISNFRADRARQIAASLCDPTFAHFPRPRRPQWAAAVMMAEYSEQLRAHLAALFPPKEIAATLGAVVSAAGLTQLRIAETEKYAHVTYFLNGGSEAPLPGEMRILVPSPKIATYDLQPEMSAPIVTDQLVAAITGRAYDLLVINYANPDMVGHTGDLNAAIRAVAAVDACVGRMVAALAVVGGTALITADHGNCEMMRDPITGQPHTAHTLNPVPVILCGAQAAGQQLHNGTLADVAPTLLQLLGLPVPAAMTGRSLLGGRG